LTMYLVLYIVKLWKRQFTQPQALISGSPLLKIKGQRCVFKRGLTVWKTGILAMSSRLVRGVSELRIHTGAGYRVYYMPRGLEVIILLAGGDKSTQQRDIEKAVELARDYRD